MEGQAEQRTGNSFRRRAAIPDFDNALLQEIAKVFGEQAEL